MRNALVLVAMTVLLTGSSWAAPGGKVLARDPQLLDSYQVTLCGDRITERDTVRIERNGMTVAEAVVVRVMADRSVVMVKGAKAPVLQAGDDVVFVSRAPMMPVQAAAPKSTELGYKVVGGHSLAFGSDISGSPDVGFGGSGGFGTSVNSGGPGFSPSGFSSSWGVSSGFSVSSSFSASPGWSASPSGFSISSFGSDLSFGQ